jgi:hypothetical protein
MPRRFCLTPEVERLILSYIRSGGYPWVAAESAGIPRAVFRQWLGRGAKSQGRGIYRRFYVNILQARAQARLGAEVETRKRDPRFWLTHGPGREKPNLPGWTNPSPGARSANKRREGKILRKEFLQMLDPILQALADFPEARHAVAQVLDKVGRSRSD